MINEKTIKLILLGGLIIALFIYHGLMVVQEYFFQAQSSSLTSLMTISRIIVTTIITFLTLQWKWLVSKSLGNAFVADSYKGISRQTENLDNIDHYENFSISQSVLWTRISGRTCLENGSVVSNWKGKLIEYDEDREFRFAIDLQTSSGTKWGIMTLRFDNGTVSGFYFPTETNERNYISTFKGMTLKLYNEKR